MAKEPEQTPAPPLDTQGLAVLAKAISDGITDASNRTGPIKQIPVTKYVPETWLNQSRVPAHRRPQFKRDYYQNGKQLEAHVLSDEEIALLERLQPGRYLNRRVEVVARDSESGAPVQIEIRYPSASIDQRLENKGMFRTFKELLTLILAEQKAA